MVGQRISEMNSAILTHTQEYQELSRIRKDTDRQLAEERAKERRLAAERDIELARIAAERARTEIELCQANQEAQRERLRSNIREVVESKVAFDVRQGLTVGELEVDVDKLKELMAQREQQPQRIAPQPQREPCQCCDRPCGCEEGLRRRHCPRCRNKPCEAEKKCGGPETLAQLEQQPQRAPLRPAEIPMKLPVYLSFGFQNPAIEGARIRHQPPIGFQPQIEGHPCDHDGKPCVDRSSTQSTSPLDEFPIHGPPVPEPDITQDHKRDPVSPAKPPGSARPAKKYMAGFFK